jgi:hypothetical protein
MHTSRRDTCQVRFTSKLTSKRFRATFQQKTVGFVTEPTKPKTLSNYFIKHVYSRLNYYIYNLREKR